MRHYVERREVVYVMYKCAPIRNCHYFIVVTESHVPLTELIHAASRYEQGNEVVFQHLTVMSSGLQAGMEELEEISPGKQGARTLQEGL